MLDRTVAPDFVKSTLFHLPNGKTEVLSNGVKISHFDEIQQSIVKIEVVFDAGKWFEPKPELAHFTSHMLDKGTVKKNAAEIAETFDRYGAHIEISSNLDHVVVSLYTLSKFLGTVFPHFCDLLTEPVFPEHELDLMKVQFIESLKVKNEKTSYVASKLIRANVFGAKHPYGQTGDENDIKNVQCPNLTEYFRSHFKPENVFILGPLKDDDKKSIVSFFGAFKRISHLVPEHTVVKTAASYETIEKANSVQSSIRLGKRSLLRTDPDYPALVLLNYYLGGFFGSRLMKNLREDKGLTYGISSSIHPFRHDAMILIGTDVNKENSKMAVDEILEELSILTRQVNEDELELARRHFIGSMQGEMASPFTILSKIKTLELYKLPTGYYQELINKIDTTSVDELKQVASKHLIGGELHKVVVG